MMNNMLPPPYHSSLMSLDLNIQDQNHEDQLSSPNSSNSSFSSLSSSSSYPILLNHPDQVQQPSYYLPNDHQEVEKINSMVSSGSWDNNSTGENHEIIKSKHKLTIRWKKEGINNNIEEVNHHHDDGTSVKWMSSKMRMMRKMIDSDQTSGGSSNIASNSKQKFEDQKQPLSPLGSSTNNYSNQIRVCSDCNTTKTPLWRSGPRGPKSLCNACGIRQRKARRAMALAAASANGTTVTADQTCSVKRKKLQKKKENKSKIDYCSTHLKKKTKFESEPSHQTKKEFITFEDLRLSLSKNLSVQQVFPQDEKEEAAILLMALSYGLVHG
ncbi:putative GATA transcription factor 22 [Trifolium pratense]|uniref:putative GATA transcription factor 22 n=1 Tax=Trifolium pratense TaxID=57577 RepID=UPI001E69516C|nr:putative GATA transcription factor 22 [Trifolium pratense]